MSFPLINRLSLSLILFSTGCNFLKYVTLFSCDTFGFYVSCVYLQYGIQVLTRQFKSWPPNTDGAIVSIVLAILMLVMSFFFQKLAEATYFHRHVRRFFADYGMPISLIATSGMAYWGRFSTYKPTTLPVGAAFQAAGGREWLVRFWQLDGKWVGIAFPFGMILWVLFFFDHNVSVNNYLNLSWFLAHLTQMPQSLIAQSSQFPLRKPPGFHYDFFLLGITTFIAGLIGVPAPNGLIPQAPIHTASLLVMGRPPKRDMTDVQSRSQITSHTVIDDQKSPLSHEITQDAQIETPIVVIEQRVSNLAQGALCLVLLTGPFLHVLHLIPRGMRCHSCLLLVWVPNVCVQVFLLGFCEFLHFPLEHKSEL